MGDAGTISESRLGQPAPLGLKDDDLALFVLNVGDGDALVLRFPISVDGRTYAVVDGFRGSKTIALIEALGGGALRWVCATHPHFDHISGLRQILRQYAGRVQEFWDSGFRYTSATYRKLLEEVVTQAPALRFMRPTSGYEMIHADAQVTVLSPSISLRNRYDTHGVDVNNASIAIRVTYPVLPPSEDYPANSTSARAERPRSRTMVLGGDAQTDAWGQVMQEFPHLDRDPKNWVRQIGGGSGAQPLACDLFKVSHHASKRGVNLELLERMGDRSGGLGPSFGPPLLVSSSASGEASSYGFPHSVTMALLREVRDPKAQKGGDHRPDDELGIHGTAQTITPTGLPAGSIAYVVGRDASAALYRMGDAFDEDVDLDNARRVN